MASGKDKSNILGLLEVLLSRRDWVYLLSLLVPLFVYNLTLKASSVASIPGLSPTFDLMRSDVFFNLGYALFWIGLFAATRGRGPLRRFVVVFFHAATMLVVLVSTFAHQYFRTTGTTLDYGIIAQWIPKLKEIVPILASGVYTLGLGTPLRRSLLRGPGTLARDACRRAVARMAGEISGPEGPRSPFLGLSGCCSWRSVSALSRCWSAPVRRTSGGSQRIVRQGPVRQRGPDGSKGSDRRRGRSERRHHYPTRRASGRERQPRADVRKREAQRRLGPPRVDPRPVRDALQRGPKDHALPGRAARRAASSSSGPTRPSRTPPRRASRSTAG